MDYTLKCRGIRAMGLFPFLWTAHDFHIMINASKKSMQDFESKTCLTYAANSHTSTTDTGVECRACISPRVSQWR